MKGVSRHGVMALAVLLIAAQLVGRGVISWQSGFYWDDFVLIGRCGAAPLWSKACLLQNHDGHLMPAAFLVAGATTKLMPLNWTPALVELLVLQALAALALLRLLWLILGPRPALVAIFACYLFSPLTLPSFAWWSAGLNALPLHAGLAWTAGETVLLVRTKRLRHAAGALLGFTVALLFFEKALLVPFAATAITALTLRVCGHRRPLRTTISRSRWLWLGYAVVVLWWTALYISAPSPRIALPPLRTAVQALWRINAQGLFPALFGGPLFWTRPPPMSALAHPPAALAIVTTMCALAFVVVSSRRVRAAPWIWALFFGYLGVCEAVMLLCRINLDPNPMLGLSLRYTADCAVMFAVAIALLTRVARGRRTEQSAQARTASPARRFGLGFATAVCCASLVSTTSFAQAWAGDPGNAYLVTARRALAQDQRTPLLDQPVPFSVLSPLSYPDNLLSHVLGPLRERPAFATSTPVLRTVDNNGNLVPGQLTYARAIGQGPIADCGYRIPAGVAESVPLTGPLTGWEWTAQLNYAASADGFAAVSLQQGQSETVPLAKGLHTVFVRLQGGGEAVVIRPLTPGLTLCVGAGPVGAVWPK